MNGVYGISHLHVNPQPYDAAAGCNFFFSYTVLISSKIYQLALSRGGGQDILQEINQHSRICYGLGLGVIIEKHEEFFCFV